MIPAAVGLTVALFAPFCPALASSAGQPVAGTAEAIHLPTQQAMDLNREGKRLYREAHFPQARAKYQAAMQLDPDFLGPALNLACAFAREERFAEAATEAERLIRRAYVPWAREVMEAADLGALQIRPELAQLKRGLEESAPQWGHAAEHGFFFVARTQPPIRLDGKGVLVLGVNQELFAWLPDSGRYLQLTAEDGRVLAFLQSPEGATVILVRAGRLVREQDAPPRLRGLSLRALDVPTMALGPVVEIAGDVEKLVMAYPNARGAQLQVTLAGGESRYFRFRGTDLEPLTPAYARLPAHAATVTLTGAGVLPGRREMPLAGCHLVARDEIEKGMPRVRVTAKGKAPVWLDARYGAGLAGLPFSTAGGAGTEHPQELAPR